jgi:hypothetical protein
MVCNMAFVHRPAFGRSGRLWVKLDKTHGEQNQSAFPSKLSLKPDIALR